MTPDPITTATTLFAAATQSQGEARAFYAGKTRNAIRGASEELARLTESFAAFEAELVRQASGQQLSTGARIE